LQACHHPPLSAPDTVSRQVVRGVAERVGHRAYEIGEALLLPRRWFDRVGIAQFLERGLGFVGGHVEPVAYF
jgi:hypothetical protein